MNRAMGNAMMARRIYPPRGRCGAKAASSARQDLPRRPQIPPQTGATTPARRPEIILARCGKGFANSLRGRSARPVGNAIFMASAAPVQPLATPAPAGPPPRAPSPPGRGFAALVTALGKAATPLRPGTADESAPTASAAVSARPVPATPAVTALAPQLQTLRQPPLRAIAGNIAAAKAPLAAEPLAATLSAPARTTVAAASAAQPVKPTPAQAKPTTPAQAVTLVTADRPPALASPAPAAPPNTVATPPPQQHPAVAASLPAAAPPAPAKETLAQPSIHAPSNPPQGAASAATHAKPSPVAATTPATPAAPLVALPVPTQPRLQVAAPQANPPAAVVAPAGQGAAPAAVKPVGTPAPADSPTPPDPAAETTSPAAVASRAVPAGPAQAAPNAAASAPATTDLTAAVAQTAPVLAPTPAPATPAAAHAAPAAQIAQAAAGVRLSATGQGDVTLHLQPGDLGAVQVHIARANDGTASVTLSVEKPETLATLQQDLAHLHQALDRAGVQVDGRQVSLHLAPPPVQSQPGNFASTGQGGGQPGWTQGQNPGGGQRGTPHSQAQQGAGAQNPDPQDPAGQSWQAYGINITA
jgi:hypothetical protein